MDKKAIVETNFSLKSLLMSFVKIFKADAVILYKFIQTDDLEATELLSLLENSPVANHKNFFEVINEDFISGYPNGFKGLIEDFRTGALKNDESTNSTLKKLKKNIKVLRFSAHAEQNPEKSRWNFDYNKRPPKYLVFSDNILKDPEKAIKYEGMTAFFCRAKKEIIDNLNNNNKNYDVNSKVKNLILDRQDLRTHPSHSTTYSDPNVYDNFSSHHAAWMILNDSINNEKPIGCLRFEFYDKNSIGEIIDNAGKKLTEFAVESVNEIIVTDIINVLEKNKELSYEKMYKCLDPLLDHIKEIGNVKRSDRSNETSDEAKEISDIHYQIEHLLYVLKRNTYFGDDIIKRIKYFIKVLLEKLSLPGDLFSDVWDRLRRHEDLMLYDLDKYRDHLMHQFHAFLCGYIIINKLGLNYFLELLNSNYLNYISRDNKNDVLKFTRLDVLRIWTLSSLFHDCGYSFEKLSEGLETFSKRVSGIMLKSKFFWDDFIFEKDIVLNIFQSMSSYYIINNIDDKTKCQIKTFHSNLTESFIFRTLAQKALTDNDHGVLSAIILMQQYYKHNEGFIGVPKIAQIINIACLAIALHNKTVFSQFNGKDNTGICLSQNPFIFLLVYCDTVTEWGRIKIPDDKNSDFSYKESKNNNDSYVSPFLKNISIEKDTIDLNCTKTSILLDYPASESGVYLDPERIDRFLKDVLDSFISPKDKSFEIRYRIRNSSVDCRSKRFKNCAYCENQKTEPGV